MDIEHLNWLGTAIFALAVAHTFAVKFFQQWAQNYPQGSVAENFLHMLGEVEVIFGIWAGVFFILHATFLGLRGAVEYVERQNFVEPMFVFVVMAMAATRPILHLANAAITNLARFIPLPRYQSFLVTSLVVGPLMGSFITEPAAMTVTALLLRRHFFEKPVSDRVRHAILAVLFVNVSIGGVLTHFAAPPLSSWFPGCLVGRPRSCSRTLDGRLRSRSL